MLHDFPRINEYQKMEKAHFLSLSGNFLIMLSYGLSACHSELCWLKKNWAKINEINKNNICIPGHFIGIPKWPVRSLSWDH